ncbi:MAG: HAMP domain-containing sensor histidine kinase [bacterium]|nr:HAMP domain-containing sensor histidine kinase [bacterium]
MKIRSIVIAVTLFLVGIYGGLLLQINTTTEEKTEFVTNNKKVKQIEEQLKQNGSIPEIDDCQVLLMTDQEYERQLYQAYAKGDTVMDLTSNNMIIGKAVFKASKVREQQLQRRLNQVVTEVFIISLCAFYIAVFYINHRFIKPFHMLQKFATEISNGNFEFSLHMPKANYFGAFTESFDLMRDQLLSAKEGEYKANRSKKELVASLSHDIKTPVATIKANCELLEAMVEEKPVRAKLAIINTKANVINELMDNMFHATLEEMEMLKVVNMEFESTKIKPMFEQINHYGYISFENEIPACLVSVDSLRLSQVSDNVISNSYKYANTKISIGFKKKEKFLCITIRDYGNGVKEEEFPMLFEKFYRGSNAVRSNGSGLGLFIAKQFMTRMQGDLVCYNDNGFVVMLSLPMV